MAKKYDASVIASGMSATCGVVPTAAIKESLQGMWQLKRGFDRSCRWSEVTAVMRSPSFSTYLQERSLLDCSAPVKGYAPRLRAVTKPLIDVLACALIGIHGLSETTSKRRLVQNFDSYS